MDGWDGESRLGHNNIRGERLARAPLSHGGPGTPTHLRTHPPHTHVPATMGGNKAPMAFLNKK